MSVIAISLHVLSAVIWVGGMFFVLLILRSATAVLEAPDRLALWNRVFSRFFPWVWLSIIMLLASGYWMIIVSWNGFSNLPVYLHMMHGIGWLMILIYLHLWFAPYKKFKFALETNALPEAASYLNQMRIIVTTNLILGILNIIIGASGRYL